MATMTSLTSSVLKPYAFFRMMTPTPPRETNLSFTYSPNKIHQSLSLSTAPNNEKHITTPPKKEIFHEFDFFVVYTDGTVEVLRPPPAFVPPFELHIKDAEIITTTNDPRLTARLFLPKNPDNKKLPVVLYFHGSGFCSRSALSPEYTNHLADIANQSNVLAVSVEYSKFPARPPPACYEEAMASLDWIALHANGAGPEPWLNDYADLQRVFVAGNSAGGNITHYVVSKVGKTGPPNGINVEGAIMVHPFFGGLGEDRQWLYMCKDNKGPEDPRLKPAAEDLNTLGCRRVLVCVAETDPLRPAGENYFRDLKNSSWGGRVELELNKGIGHSDQVYKPYDENSRLVVPRIATFIKQQ
ncbi:hypothetical protein HN51_031207 [Arachis hypogaea]|uniref:Alpha/beta hydrolase fold-3 domain-containing protein n=3 Tax=Arachis TaxID=3817 RepID=A0A0A7E0N9_ARAHY|nr:probable carboxylesterase 1 [Arachis duranensis]XP_025622897.1 probable carboxylesterase 1 [Arachis hypogaea]AIY56604.1 hypothetical protein [Arachis hypogaea]QHO15790.1 putative carboxylesterase [Arachis hypogaea]RYR34858.1 hypothetical protein Ahy_A10g049904 isoform A [Arachis hypogaea]